MAAWSRRICARNRPFHAQSFIGLLMMSKEFVMKKAMDLMSKSESVIRYDVICKDEGGDIKTDTVFADSSVLIGEVSKYWLLSFANDLTADHPDMVVEISSPSEQATFNYKDGELVGGKKPAVQSKEMIEKYGECFSEKDLEKARKKSGATEFTQEEIEAVDGLMRDEKTLSYSINCCSGKTKKIAKTDSILASEWLSPVDVLRFWIDQNSNEIPNPCTTAISLNGKEIARMDHKV